MIKQDGTVDFKVTFFSEPHAVALEKVRNGTKRICKFNIKGEYVTNNIVIIGKLISKKIPFTTDERKYAGMIEPTKGLRKKKDEETIKETIKETIDEQEVTETTTNMFE